MYSPGMDSSQRNTKTKEAVHKTLQSSHIPMTLQQLWDRVNKRFPATAYSTVFRIVKHLEKEGKVTKVDWRQRRSRYEWAMRAHHHHLVCERCDKTVDIDDTQLRYNNDAVAQKTGFVIKTHAIELTGVCNTCQK